MISPHAGSHAPILAPNSITMDAKVKFTGRDHVQVVLTLEKVELLIEMLHQQLQWLHELKELEPSCKWIRVGNLYGTHRMDYSGWVLVLLFDEQEMMGFFGLRCRGSIVLIPSFPHPEMFVPDR